MAENRGKGKATVTTTANSGILVRDVKVKVSLRLIQQLAMGSATFNASKCPDTMIASAHLALRAKVSHSLR